jgi:hypothetical protein
MHETCAAPLEEEMKMLDFGNDNEATLSEFKMEPL